MLRCVHWIEGFKIEGEDILNKKWSLIIGMGGSIYTGEGKDYAVTSLIFCGSSSY